MGWRFRRSVKVFPGVRVNFGKKGFTSTTVGKGLFSANINSDGVRTSHNVPGTGLTYQGERTAFSAGSSDGPAPGVSGGAVVVIVLGVVIGACAVCGGIGSLVPPSPVANTPVAPLKSSYAPIASPSPSPKWKKKAKPAPSPQLVPLAGADLDDGSVSGSSRGTRSSKYILGPRGGCYYINGNGRKTYVEHSLCD